MRRGAVPKIPYRDNWLRGEYRKSKSNPSSGSVEREDIMTHQIKEEDRKWFTISLQTYPRTMTRSEYKAVSSWLRKASGYIRKALKDTMP